MENKINKWTPFGVPVRIQSQISVTAAHTTRATMETAVACWIEALLQRLVLQKHSLKSEVAEKLVGISGLQNRITPSTPETQRKEH